MKAVKVTLAQKIAKHIHETNIMQACEAGELIQSRRKRSTKAWEDVARNHYFNWQTMDYRVAVIEVASPEMLSWARRARELEVFFDAEGDVVGALPQGNTTEQRYALELMHGGPILSGGTFRDSSISVWISEIPDEAIALMDAVLL